MLGAWSGGGAGVLLLGQAFFLRDWAEKIKIFLNLVDVSVKKFKEVKSFRVSERFSSVFWERKRGVFLPVFNGGERDPFKKS